MLVLAEGAGAAMRPSLGIDVLAGMVCVTFFGVMFTPVFFFLIERTSAARRKTRG